MPQQLLWVHKDAQSATLSQSSRAEESKIRKHVQSTRRNQSGQMVSQSAADVISLYLEELPYSPDDPKDALRTSLRPSNDLGRLALTGEALTHVRRRPPKQGTKRSLSILARISRAHRISPPVPRQLPWMWPGFSPIERRSLLFFEQRTSKDWTGWQDASFWGGLVLQVSQHSDAVARSLLALSALHESSEVTGKSKTDLQCFSYSQTTQAVSILASSNLSHFEALVSCLALICLQNLQRSRLSFPLLRSGTGMLDEYHGKVSSEETCLIETNIRSLYSRLSCRSCRMGGLSEAFAISVHRQRDKEHGCHSATPPLVPHRFNTLLEAKDSLHAIFQWAHDNTPHHIGAHADWHCFSQSLEQLRAAWEAALNPGLSDTSARKSSDSNRSRVLLVAACIIGMVIIKTAGSPNEIVYDQYLTDFQEIVRLIEDVDALSVTPFREMSFGIDDGLIDILAFVASKCRDPILRRRALDLLVRGTRIEGDRVTSIPADILRVHIDLEEENLDVHSCYDIPEKSRRRLLRGHQVNARRRVDLFFAASPYNANLNPPVDQRHVSLQVPTDDVKSAKKHGDDKPDAIYGAGYAAFLDSDQKTYVRFDLDRFYFPVPRV